MAIRPFVSAAVLSLISTICSAQRQQLNLSADEITQMTISTAFRKITLTPEQSARAADVITAWHVEKAQLDATATEYREQIASLKAKYHLKMRNLLTSDTDRVQFDANAKEEAARWARPTRPPKPAS